MDKEYFICSKIVIDLLKPKEVSKPITTYPDSEYLKENVYVAVLDFNKVQEIYKATCKEDNFWCQQIVHGLMNVDDIQLSDFKTQCPWSVIENKLSLTKDNNRAMTISNICHREGLTPIEFWNTIHNGKENY